MRYEGKPLKRSKQLAPLSREHHDGLLFVWKLRQGLRNDTHMGTLREFCNWYWRSHIKPHFHQEEAILIPHLAANDKLAMQIKQEHNDIRDLILSIDHEPDVLVIELLANLLERHIRFEERTFFPHLEATLLPEQMQDIYKELEESPGCSSGSQWSQEFWIRNGKGGFLPD